VSGSARRVLLLTGAAEGFGVSIAATFASAGYDIIGLARSDRATAALTRAAGESGGAYTHLPCDITQGPAVAEALQPCAERIDAVIHNAQTLLVKLFGETSTAEFEQVWRVACFGAMAVAKIVLPHMAARRSGAIILSGATAAWRGGPKFSAFASAKFALRGFAQALSREFGSQGVHVAHVVLDGLIDEPQSDRRFGPSQSARMAPDALARAYLGLVEQHPSAWTHELDLRPFSGQY